MVALSLREPVAGGCIAQRADPDDLDPVVAA
jgi:hypothetical protein